MWKKLMKELNLTDSYVSMGLGLLVVLIFGVLMINYFSNKSNPTISETGEQTSEEANQKTELPATYTVQNGETLWSIAEKYYQSGYNWVDIAKVNNLTDASLIETGQEITIPVVTPIIVETSLEQTQITETQAQPTINIPATYTVISGNSLWQIAVSIYNDGYRWIDIAKANNLTNPDIIHSGNILTLPR